MRATAAVFKWMGLVMLVAGVALGAWAAVADSELALGLGVVGATLAVVGVVFVPIGRWLGGLDTSEILRTGIPGTAQVLSTRDTGTIINNVNLVVELGLLVTVPDRPSYETRVRHVAQGRTQWGAIQPGMVVAVKVDPNDPSKVAVDPEGGATAMSWDAGAAPWDGVVAPAHPAPVDGATAAPGSARVVPLSGADIVARGVATDGRLEQVTPAGMTAGLVAGGLAPHEADDPVVHVAFTYSGPAGQQLRQDALMRVPDGKAGYLAAGAVVPVAYLPDAPHQATIDWARLGAGPIV